MYKMILTDGTTIEFSGMNGTNFIVPDHKEMDVSVFTDDNLTDVVVETDEGKEIECHNLSFTQQQQQLDGDYYICFHEKSDMEIAEEELRDLIVQIAEIEVSNGNLEIEDIPGSLQDAVRVKLDDSKWKDK